MEPAPPLKPPRGLKPVKETSGLLMSVIRTLSASETNEQRDKEKSKLEDQYKKCDQRLDKLVKQHEVDLTKCMHLFSSASQIVSDNRTKIRLVKEKLQDCKKKLHCRRDELKSLWLEGLQYKHMLQLLEEIEKINEVPNQLANFISKKQYLHATKLLVEAVSLGKGSLDGVESLKEISRELEQKKEQLHIQLLYELKQYLYTKPSQNVLNLRRQGSGFLINSPLQRSTELRRSGRSRPVPKKDIEDALTQLDFQFDNNQLDSAYLDDNTHHSLAIIVKSLSLVDKLPYCLSDIQIEMANNLKSIVEKSTQYMRDYTEGGDGKVALKELIQIVFEQFKDIAHVQSIFLTYLNRIGGNFKPYSINYYWEQVQNVLESFLNDYLDIQNRPMDIEVNEIASNNDISVYFSRRKAPMKKKTLFKFEGSSSALTLSSTIKSTVKSKLLACQPHPNNILTIFIPFMCFIDEIEQILNVKTCALNKFLQEYVTNVYLKQKSEEIRMQIDVAVRASDAWRATVLLNASSDYKPVLNSTVTVERCIREWRAILAALPLYSENVADLSCKGLKEYKDTCYAAYRGIVQPHSEDRRICSAAWLKDEDISRFLKSLPNWLNLKAQQEIQARNERTKRPLKRSEASEEESPDDVRIRNRREAEILASNLGEGGVSANDILSDMVLLKDLAQLQESMEWFTVKMFQFTSEFRQEPSHLTPNGRQNAIPTVSPSVLQQLTSVAQEFDELSNTCLLLLHLEVRVQCFHYLLAQTHLNKDTHEPDPKVLELSRVLANVDEAVTSSLHARKCKYIFEGLGHLIAKILISSAQYMQIIDEVVIQRMCRNIFALQQTLTNITMSREVALDHARHYFELFFLTPEEILNGIVDKGPEFSELEYMNALNLLHRSKAGKEMSPVVVYLERLSDILGEVGITV